MAIVEALNVKCSEKIGVTKIAEMAALTIPRRASDDDADLQFNAYWYRLRPYPPDVVAQVIDEFITESKFLPTWNEMHTRLEVATSWRRCALNAIRGAYQRSRRTDVAEEV